MKMQLRGIQITYQRNNIIYLPEVKQMTVDCHLGSLIITKQELLDYLEKRLKGKK